MGILSRGKELLGLQGASRVCFIRRPPGGISTGILAWRFDGTYLRPLHGVDGASVGWVWDGHRMKPEGARHRLSYWDVEGDQVVGPNGRNAWSIEGAKLSANSGERVWVLDGRTFRPATLGSLSGWTVSGPLPPMVVLAAAAGLLEIAQ